MAYQKKSSQIKGQILRQDYFSGAKQIKSSAYHPESQGALERFHSTLKNMIRTSCLDNKETGMNVSACYCLQLGSQFKSLEALVHLSLLSSQAVERQLVI